MEPPRVPYPHEKKSLHEKTVMLTSANRKKLKLKITQRNRIILIRLILSKLNYLNQNRYKGSNMNVTGMSDSDHASATVSAVEMIQPN